MIRYLSFSLRPSANLRRSGKRIEYFHGTAYGGVESRILLVELKGIEDAADVILNTVKAPSLGLQLKVA